MRSSLPSTRALWPALLALLLTAGAAGAAGSAQTAALQVSLRERGLYADDVDGLYGPATSAAVRALQRRLGLPATGNVGPLTRHSLGVYARRDLGVRDLLFGASGWDVAELQFLLAWHGFPSGVFDGLFGIRTQGAVVRYERWLGLFPDGIAGPAVLAGLRAPPPQSPFELAWPLRLPVGDRFGPRGDRFHSGIDIPAPFGTPVAAARAGRVSYAGPRAGGWGIEVTIAHGRGVRTIYAHLSSVAVIVGGQVEQGATIGFVGATGYATGPHLHFEVRVRGAAVDPLGALRSASGS
jgi:peptidoglycan hydrolase-like protein with peptidoglycan-binding domain